jgi:hypothetical protein
VGFDLRTSAKIGVTASEDINMELENKQRRIAIVFLSLFLVLVLGLLFLYIRQRLFTQAEPIVLAT